MLNCLCKKTTMSFEDFFRPDDVETFASKIKENRITERVTVVFIAFVLHANTVMAASTNGSDGIDHLGYLLLGLIRHWGKWILLIMCLAECISSAANKDTKKILSIVVRYVVLFMLMYLIPELFDAIAASFSK